MSSDVQEDGQQEDTGDDAPDVSSLVEVFRTDVEIVAMMVQDELLQPAGIYAALHDRRSHSMPAPASMTGGLGIAVPEIDAARAREVLRQARIDKILLDDGIIIEESEG